MGTIKPIYGDNGGFSIIPPGQAYAVTLRAAVLVDSTGAEITPVKAGDGLAMTGVYSSTTPPTMTSGQSGTVQLSARAEMGVMPVGAAAAAADASSNTLAYQPGSGGMANPGYKTAMAGFRFNGASWDRERKASATSRIVSSAATTNATVAKAGAGDIFSVQGFNTTGAAIYLKLYNKATSPSVGTDTPVKTIMIPAGGAVSASCAWPTGFYFSAGISYALTGAAADSDTTAITAGAIVCLNIDYQ